MLSQLVTINCDLCSDTYYSRTDNWYRHLIDMDGWERAYISDMYLCSIYFRGPLVVQFGSEVVLEHHVPRVWNWRQ